jgi:hypothetical protein
VFFDGDGNLFELWEREDDDWHECETKIPGFDNSEQLIQKNLGPLHLRYVLEDNFRRKARNSVYKQMERWTGGGRGSVDAQNAFDERVDDIERLADEIVDFIQYDGIITVITPPKSCNRDSGRCSKKNQKNHLGYKIGLRVSKRIREVVGDVKHIMAWDLYRCDFPSGVSGIRWSEKAGRKYGRWIDDAKASATTRINESDLVVIVDDTMISYMSQLRIAMSVRKYNPGVPILCAAVFGLIPWPSGQGSRGPEEVYPWLLNAVE